VSRFGVGLLAAFALVVGACSGSDPVASPEPTATPLVSATPTPEPEPTATPEPTASPAPTPTPGPTDEELAVIAAWERYVVLSHEARGNDPSAEALDFESYMTEGALDGVLGAIAGDRERERYILGRVRTSLSSVAFRSDGDVVVEGCVVTDLTVWAELDDSLLFEEGELTVEARGRLSLRGGKWLVAAAEFLGDTCDV